MKKYLTELGVRKSNSMDFFCERKLEDPNRSNLEYLSFHMQIKISMSQEEEI